MFYKILFSLDPACNAYHPVGVKLPPKAHFLAAAACLVFPMSALLFATDAPSEKINDTQILSALQRGDTLIAATQKGIFEADLKQKTWRALGAPVDFPTGGLLLQQSADSAVIYYFRGWSWYPEATRYAKGETPAFLAISKDAGRTWKNIRLNDRHITHFCPGQNGTLFAIESSKTRPPHSLRTEGTLLLASQDEGLTWKDISGNFQDDFEYLGKSSSQSGKILVMAHAGIGFVDGFLVDEKTCEVQASEHAVFFYEHGDASSGLHTGSLAYGDGIHATIANFFRYPFFQSGNGLTVDVVQVQTEKSAYTFRRDGPKIIHVKVVMLEDRPAAKFADFEDERLFWGLHMVMGEGTDDVQFPPLTFLKLGLGKTFKSGQTFDEPKNAYNPLMDDTGMKTVILDIRHPYERDIDLAKFFDFAETRAPNFIKIPTYKIQLFHSDAGVIRHGGAFNSPAIDVTITP